MRNKRARIVLDKIAASGSITTDELKEIGYNHPPRAARDVRELGFSLETRMITGSSGRRMASYAFGDKSLESSKRGRKQLPKKLRNTIIEEAGHRCRICGADNNLQVDHRIPYEIAGESCQSDAHPYQVLCGSCNKTKSWDRANAS
ncbi:MAG: HNH endonuclease [Acidobacteriaceae bacterium]